MLFYRGIDGVVDKYIKGLKILLGIEYNINR